MIPKIIHFCWFGENQHTPIVTRCIESWKIMCPDYEIVEWNETNFDININTFVKEAYETKKWAFVSDFVRLYVLYKYGGVYVDSDVEILKNIDKLMLNGGVITGYQGATIPAGIMAAEVDNEWIKLLLDYYNNRHFIKDDGTYDMETNSNIITHISVHKCDYKIGDQHIKMGNVMLYPSIYFSPMKRHVLGNNLFSHKNFVIDSVKTFSIHYGTGTWANQSFSRIIIKYIVGILREILPLECYEKIKYTIIKLRRT